MLRIVGWQEIESDHAFLDAWRDLEDAALEPNPFLAPAMLLAAARHLEGGARMALLVDQEPHGRLRFLLPVVDALPRDAAPVRSRLSRAGVGITGLRTWLHPYCFLGTPLLAAREDPAALWRGVLQGLRQGLRQGTGRGTGGRRPWIELPMLDARGPVATALDTALGDVPGGVVREDLGERGIARRRPEGDYLAQWTTSKQRSNLGRRRRGLSASVERLRCTDRAADPDGFDAALEEFLELEARGWKGAQRTALAARPHHAAFVRDALGPLAEDKRVVLLSLEAAHGPIAQSIALRAGDAEFGFKRSYDPDHGRFSPGSLLDVEMLERFHREGAARLDTCSYPGVATHDVFGDRYAMSTVVVATSPAGRIAVERAWPVLAAARARLAAVGAGERLRALRRGAVTAPVTERASPRL